MTREALPERHAGLRSRLAAGSARLLIPLSALAAMAAFAAHEVDPVGAAESAYLARLAAAVLLAIAALAPRPAFELGTGAALATAIVWALPAGPGRGAAMALLLAATLAIAAVRRIGRGGHGLAFSTALPLAFAAQILLRGELLFLPRPDPRTLIAFLALPTAAALAITLLAARRGAALALVAGAAAVTLGPGLNVATTSALVALAAGDRLRDPGTARFRRPLQALAGLVLLVPIAWEPRTGWAVALAGLALGWPGWALTLAAADAVVIPFVHGDSAWTASSTGLASLVWLALLLPTCIVPGRGRITPMIAAALLVFATPWIPDRSALAAPVALAALSLAAEGALAAVQRVWTGTLLAATALLAAYPWLRHDPSAEALKLVGGSAGPLFALALLAGAAALAAAASVLFREGGPRRARGAAAAAAAALFLLVLLALPPSGGALLSADRAVLLDGAHPIWQQRLDASPIRRLVIDSSLANSALLGTGAPVARVRLVDRQGKSFTATLRAGIETGEWAARREDVARTARARAPRPWVSWVAGRFFGQRYRSRIALDSLRPPARLTIERDPGLPPDVTVALHAVETER